MASTVTEPPRRAVGGEHQVSISSVIQASLFTASARPTRTSADPLASTSSSSPSVSQSDPSSGASATGSAALFQHLANDLQAFLLHMQAGLQDPGATTAPGATLGAPAGATAASYSPTAAGSDASSGTDATSGTGAAKRQRHHSGTQETGDAGQMRAEANILMSNLTSRTGSGNDPASSSGMSSTAAASAASGSSNISASFFGAFRAYSSTTGQSSLPTQLGFA